MTDLPMYRQIWRATKTAQDYELRLVNLVTPTDGQTLEQVIFAVQYTADDLRKLAAMLLDVAKGP